jgi:hypothetical protein
MLHLWDEGNPTSSSSNNGAAAGGGSSNNNNSVTKPGAAVAADGPAAAAVPTPSMVPQSRPEPARGETDDVEVDFDDDEDVL